MSHFEGKAQKRSTFSHLKISLDLQSQEWITSPPNSCSRSIPGITHATFSLVAITSQRQMYSNSVLFEPLVTTALILQKPLVPSYLVDSITELDPLFDKLYSFRRFCCIKFCLNQFYFQIEQKNHKKAIHIRCLNKCSKIYSITMNGLSQMKREGSIYS